MLCRSTRLRFVSGTLALPMVGAVIGLMMRVGAEATALLLMYRGTIFRNTSPGSMRTPMVAMVCHLKRSGNTRRVRGQQRHSGRVSGSAPIRPILTEIIPTTAQAKARIDGIRFLLGVSKPILGAFTMYMGTLRNGRKIVGPIPCVTIPRMVRQICAGTVRCAFSAGAPGSADLKSSAPPVASGTYPRDGAATSASVSSRPSRAATAALIPANTRVIFSGRWYYTNSPKS